MISCIVAELTIELGLTDEADISVLEVKVRGAVREVKAARNYQPHHTDEFISADLERFHSNIHNLAMYDYCQVGAEGQASHNENSINRTWTDRSECLKGVTPFVGTW